MIHARPDYNRFQDPIGKIRADEPVFLARAQDSKFCDILAYAIGQYRSVGAVAVADRLDDHLRLAANWQNENRDLVKTADLPAPEPSQFHKTGKHPEKVLGIRRDYLEQVLGPSSLLGGFLWDNGGVLYDVLGASEYRVRDECENDPSFKQIIPYVVFTWRQYISTDDPMVFCYTRGKGGGENRLTSKRSVGVGGHVEESDETEGSSSRTDAYFAALIRELDQEVAFIPKLNYDGSIKPEHVSKVFGFINDDTPDPAGGVGVGQVHLGVVHSVELASPVVVSKEKHALAEPGFVSLSLLPTFRDQFETWSQILIDNRLAHA